MNPIYSRKIFTDVVIFSAVFEILQTRNNFIVVSFLVDSPCFRHPGDNILASS